MKAKNDFTLTMANKINDPKATPKTYWSILSRFLYEKGSSNPFFITKW